MDAYNADQDEITIARIYTDVILECHKCLRNNLSTLDQGYLVGFGPYFHVTVGCYRCKLGKNEEGMFMDTYTETSLRTPATKNCVKFRRSNLRRTSLDAISDAKRLSSRDELAYDIGDAVFCPNPSMLLFRFTIM